MAILKIWPLFLLSHLLLHGLILAQPANFTSCNNDIGNYTKYSTFQNNLNTLLSSLSSNIDPYGFYNASIGQINDKVSAVVLCRGDVLLEDCRRCVNSIAQGLVNNCTNQKEAFGFLDECILQYSGGSIIGATFNSPIIYWYNEENATRPVEFYLELKKLLEKLRGQAANGPNNQFKKYASDSSNKTVYALVQCTPDLSPQSCTDCLTKLYGKIPNCTCNGKKGGRIIGPRCNFRYESDPLFEEVVSQAPLQRPSPPTPPPPPPPPPSLGNDDGTTRTVVIVVVTIVTVLILIVFVSLLMKRRRKKKPVNEIENIRADDISTAESLQYDFVTIREATNNFSNANKLGQGGFGSVYKGKLSNGREVAVKRLSANSGQGDLEFKNEVVLVARLQHRNLVRLLGFCLDGTERLLVYEFATNASLDKFLFDPVKRRQLNWERRSKIIVGVAKGILYLHEDSRLRIIHRDLKASNVLLDAEMNPKIADFGMARLFTLDETQGSTSRIVGTYGYMAPEYAMHGQFSVKSDVFSFGVLVLEILSGQRTTCFRNGESFEDLLSYAWSNWHEGTASNFIDPMLRESTGLVRDIIRSIHIALLCVQENVADRPTMAAVVLMLSSHSLSLPLPSAPAYSRMPESGEIAKIESIGSTRNEVSITELYPR